jgi:ubiquinone biosynthesis protein
MAYQDGFFHADLHPGNILVRHDGSIALVDFGIMGILPEKDRIAVAEILYALFRKDYDKVAKIHKKLGYIPASTNLDRFAISMRSICDPVIDSAIKDISIGSLLSKLFKISEEYGMEVQPQLITLQKTIIVLEGIGQSLDPEINMWKLAEPWIKKWAIKNLTPEAKIFKFLKNKLEEILEEY